MVLSFLMVGKYTNAQGTIVIQDPLTNGTAAGTQVGGSFSAEGYKPGLGAGHILYDSPVQVTNGYIEFQVKGFVASQIVSSSGNADNGLFGMYDGRGCPEPIPYFEDFKCNYFRWNFHYREQRKAFKAVLTVAAPLPERINATRAVFPYDSQGLIDRDWFTEPTGIDYSMNSTSWYTVRCEWNNKTFKVTINGTSVWGPFSGPYDYAPIDFKIWLGSAPGFGEKYTNLLANVVYRNFKLVTYGSVTPPVNTPPVITSSPVTSGIVGQLYSYDVNATGNPSPTFSLINNPPSGMSINPTTGLIQWTPPSIGSFNVSVKAANGVNPDATQSFSINVTQPTQNTPPVITSSPVTLGIVGQLYSYDVNATGNPTPTFSLINNPPSGMSINPTTGLIQWTPPSIGSFNVSVKAANGVNPDATQSFVILVQNNQTGDCPNGIISYWKLDETSGSTYADYVGTNNATSTNLPTPTSGRVNGAQLFNGTSNAITAPRIANYDFAVNTSFTFEAWVKHPTGSISNEEIIMERKPSSGALAINLKFDSSPNAKFSVRNNNYAEIFSVEGTTNLLDNNWHHIVGVRDAITNQLKIYVDGVLEDTASAVYTAGFTSAVEGISIGWRRSTNNKFFNGSIDEVAIYNSALDAATILQHYNNGLQNTGYCGTIPPPVAACPQELISYWKLDETSGSTYADYVGTNNATSSNLPTSTTGRVNGAQLFNGTSNSITAPRIAAYDFAVNTSFTFEAWVKHPTGSISNEEIIMERKPSSGALAINLKFDSSPYAKFSVRNNNYAEIFWVQGTTSLLDNNWHHVVGVRDASTNQLKIYVNGVLENTTSASYTSGFTSVNEGISIGRRSSTNNKFFNGSIDEVAVYNSALDAATILQHYNNGLLNQGYCQNTLTKSAVSNVDIFSTVESHVNGNSVQLTWEINTNLTDGKFEVERNENSMSITQDWQKISEMDLSARGELKSFVFVDNLNTSGKFSYRIKYANGGTEIYSQQIETEVLPMDYVLYQNYPNPFNPSTKISFAVPSSGKVSIQIYNQLGELISQPVDNFFEAGNYEVQVNMHNFASGVYFYKLTSGSFSDLKKMVLTK